MHDSVVLRRRYSVVLCVAGWMLVPACGDGFGRRACYPERLQVSPSTAPPGGSVTLSAPAASCGAGELDNVTYRISLLEFRSEPRELAQVTTAAGGEFSVEVQIPDDARPGGAHLVISGSAYDQCDDDTECAGYGTQINVVS